MQENETVPLAPHDLTVPALSAFVWTRFGVEAGETVESILARKERERVAGDGTFLWGIGNSVGRAISLLALERPPVVIFSPIAGSPRKVDAESAGTLRWMHAHDWLGFPAAMPIGASVTSRAGRRTHYALVCRSSVPLCFDGVQTFCLDALTNLESGRSVGASQTTAVVRRGTAATGRVYRAAMILQLVPPYFLQLSNGVPLSPETGPGRG